MAKHSFRSTDIVPHKCGIVLKPPAVIYIYENKATKKLRKLLMPVHNVSVNSDIEFFAEDLKMRHKPLLDGVNLEIIKKMIFLLVQHKDGVPIADALLKFDEIETYKTELKHKSVSEILKTLDMDLEDDLAVDTDIDDLEAPIDKLGLYSDEEADFWK